MGPTKDTSLTQGLLCSDYLTFLGTSAGLCGARSGEKLVRPVSGRLGLAVRADTATSPGREVDYRLDYDFLDMCQEL